jgi:tetratricopeptide (TPR) repeat protein
VRKEPWPGSRGKRGALALGFLGISVLLAATATLVLLGPSTARGGPAPRGPASLEAAKLAFADRDFARAKNLLEELLKSDWKNVSARLLLGRVLYEQGRLVAARETFTAVLKEEKDNEEAVRGLAGTYEALNQPDLAAVWWQRAVALNKGRDAEPHLRLARVLSKSDFADAMAALEQARAIDPKREDVEALFQEILAAQATPANPPGVPRAGMVFPLRPPAAPDPRTIAPVPQAPDPAKGFPKPQGRNP